MYMCDHLQEVVRDYGADSVRLYMLFKAPPYMDMKWDIKGASTVKCPPFWRPPLSILQGGWINGSAIVGTKRVPSTIVHALAVQIFRVVGVACAVRSTNTLNNVVIARYHTFGEKNPGGGGTDIYTGDTLTVFYSTCLI